MAKSKSTDKLALLTDLSKSWIDNPANKDKKYTLELTWKEFVITDASSIFLPEVKFTILE